MYAQRLIEGPPITPELREVLVLVLLLRYDEVAADFPNNALTKYMDMRAHQCGVTVDVRSEWTRRCAHHFQQTNSTALALSKVRTPFVVYLRYITDHAWYTLGI